GSKLPPTVEVPNSWDKVPVSGMAAASCCAVYFWQLMAAERGPVSAKATTWHALLPYFFDSYEVEKDHEYLSRFPA
ncbi:MAG: hypothetical protein O7C75_02350, partial [Verrucomicrobia bacterium]|nr:hypothetical protein [Verrucomicrobiota bacterium]